MVIDLLLFYLIHFENLSLEAKNFHIKFYSNYASSCCQKTSKPVTDIIIRITYSTYVC